MPTFTPWADGPNQLSASAATIYTVPASTTTVIECITVTNTDSSARTYTISIGTDGAGTRIFAGVTIAANTTAIHLGKWVLAAAEIIQASADSASKVNVTMAGFTRV